jgi:Ca2+/Na+ antiporter
MTRTDRARRWLLAGDGAGLVIYLFWLATRGERLFYHADGVIYLLPCILFLFVFLYLRHGEPRKEEPED